MRFEVKTGSATKLKTSCLILPVFSSGPLPATTRTVDAACHGLIADLVDGGDIRGKIGDTLIAHAGAALAAKRIMLVGCGEKGKFNRKQYRKALRAAYAALGRTRHTDATSTLHLEAVKGADVARRASIAAEVWQNASYRYTETRSESNDNDSEIESLALLAGSGKAADVRKGLKRGAAIGAGMRLSRELGNLPANVCTPSHLAATARKIARGNDKLKVEVFGEAEMKKFGMGSLLSVTAGTVEPAKLIVMRYSGAAKKEAPIALVGKGVTFDSGGISLKPGAGMDEMKFDMCGAATVLGCMEAIASLKLRLNVIGCVPACENLPSGVATKPGDIVTSMAGKTIEVLNTDAEGRLILCDALTYVQKYKPRAVIDIATLTGACLVALGRHRSGLLSNSDKLAKALQKAGDNADDPSWRLPLGDEYRQLLKSNFADLANIGGRDAGTITAACFLSEFVKDVEWAHLDIAGTAWLTGPKKGSTGRPIPLLLEYLAGIA
ncbi:MAG: leucyl aminopeptidase [Gammaproteobacteria bacterium]|nr:leucyl aminopeptidase [Gammaproteobacteria bacterium]